MNRSDDRGSMPLALLLVLVGTTVSAMLATFVVSSVHNSDYGIRRMSALQAAQTGLDVARAQIRAADYGTKSDAGDDDGNAGMLPCGPLRGYVDKAKTASYSVQIRYYASDPQAMTDQQRNTLQIACAGLYAPSSVPAYALFSATGTVTKGDTSSRLIEGTYIVHTSNANIAGGLVHYGSTLCLDAGSSDPAAGDKVTVETCNPGKLSQTWAYTENLQFQLVSSQTPAHPQGMCLDANANHSLATNAIVMGLCETAAPARYRQAWSFDDNAHLDGSKSDGSNIDTSCFVVVGGAAGSGINLGSSSCSVFSADANAGAGAASSAAGQAAGMLVNYQQFGRCLDITEANVGKGYMIAWPCKQNPNMNLVKWNQRYTTPALPANKAGDPANKATGTITTNNGSVYCLQSPMSATGYVNPMACVNGRNDQQWTVYGRTNAYATSYQIVDGSGKYCLQPDPSDLYSSGSSVAKIKVALCTGSTLQKWNASKNVVDALALKDLTEKPASASGGS
ncbi:RICIN domain-containing protein [Actinoplanes sp. KI2]|uniref:RICIN domain-containing protein n=1 Tax=Actinoplanes sp. KI2 TaxID=2983315 RepID=UPI0021D5EEDC|nr:RICIN domain-containing protein [Actinoplanes sp. KI2]MCU7729270.1 RICIN domain-containing protein [Actinoplanes sp. KI2]